MLDPAGIERRDVLRGDQPPVGDHTNLPDPEP